MALTRLPVTTYFRKLVTGSTPRSRIKDVGLDPRPGVNHIYSNVQQIIRHPYARELDAESVKSLEFLVNLLCEESFLLCNQKYLWRNGSSHQDRKPGSVHRSWFSASLSHWLFFREGV